MSIQPAFALDTPVTCSSEMLNLYQCDACFDAGTIYESRTAMSLSDTVNNAGSLRNFHFKSENKLSDNINIFNR